MNIRSIDEVLETFVTERMEQGRDRAKERFLANVYLKHGGDEILDFLLKVGGLARCYIYCLKIADNPFKGPDLAWLGAMAAVGGYGAYIAAVEASHLLGLVLLSGAMVHGWSLMKMMIKKSRAIGLRISIYSELVQIVEKELCR